MKVFTDEEKGRIGTLAKLLTDKIVSLVHSTDFETQCMVDEMIRCLRGVNALIARAVVTPSSEPEI